MPNNWKTEADAPSAYPLNSATTFFSGNSFAGIDQCIVTTYAYNLNAARQIVSFLDNTGVKYRLAIGEDQWGAWKQISTATPPQEFDLPLAEGWTGLAKYYKTQENICFIELDILKNATIQNGEVLATLPEGFRPSYLRMQPAIVYSPHGSTTIDVSPTGSVLFGDMSGSPSARNIYATLVFVAAS